MSEPAMLTFHQCNHCGTLNASCIDLCSICLNRDMLPIQIPGRGRLVSWTTIRKPPLKFKADGIYHVGVFDLDNGQRVTGRFLLQEGDALGDRVIALPDPHPAMTTPTFKVDKHV